jgi:hypothetical protein
MTEDSKQYNDIEGLRLILEGMEKTTPRMRKASLEFAFDKYVRCAPPSVTDDSQLEFLRKRFCDVVPGLSSKSWEDIWERVRERFKDSSR